MRPARSPPPEAPAARLASLPNLAGIDVFVITTPHQHTDREILSGKELTSALRSGTSRPAIRPARSAKDRRSDPHATPTVLRQADLVSDSKTTTPATPHPPNGTRRRQSPRQSRNESAHGRQ